MKKQLTMLMLVLAMVFSLCACSNDEKPKEPGTNDDAGEILGVQKEDVNDDEGKYFIKELDVKKFDSSKFDKVVKLDTGTLSNERHLDMNAPFTFKDLQDAGLYFKENSSIHENLNLTPEEGDWAMGDALYTDNDTTEDGNVIVCDLLVPATKDTGLTYKQILEEGTFLLYMEDYLLGKLINCDREYSSSTEFKDVVATLGNPSMIMGDAMSLDGDLSSATFSYIYNYGDFALIFYGLEFTGDDDSGTFYEFYFASNQKALDAYIKFMEECDMKVLAQ